MALIAGMISCRCRDKAAGMVAILAHRRALARVIHMVHLDCRVALSATTCNNHRNDARTGNLCLASRVVGDVAAHAGAAMMRNAAKNRVCGRVILMAVEAEYRSTASAVRCIPEVGGQAVLGRQNILPTPWLTE